MGWYLCLHQAITLGFEGPCFCCAGGTLPAAEVALNDLQTRDGDGDDVGALNKDREPMFGL